MQDGQPMSKENTVQQTLKLKRSRKTKKALSQNVKAKTCWEPKTAEKDEELSGDKEL